MTCSNCGGNTRVEIVRTSCDGVAWVTKIVTRCLSHRQRLKCPTLIGLEGEEPSVIQPAPVRLPSRRLTRSEQLKGRPEP